MAAISRDQSRAWRAPTMGRSRRLSVTCFVASCTFGQMMDSPNPPSIFNDVLGPVMRGPSSSHSAAAQRIGRLARDLMKGSIQRVRVDYDPSGSLVTTHRTQGSDLGLAGGLLGWEADDARLKNYPQELKKAGIDIEVRYLDYGATHPNTYRLELQAGETTRSLTAISTGGGMIEVQSLDSIPVCLHGDYRHAKPFRQSVDVDFNLPIACQVDHVQRDDRRQPQRQHLADEKQVPLQVGCIDNR